MKHLRKDYDVIQPELPFDKYIHVENFDGRSHVFELEDHKPKIPEDEPVFLLRSKDKFAPGLVRKWCELIEDELSSQSKDKYDHDLSEALQRVRTWADQMERYAMNHYAHGKTPTIPLDQLQPYPDERELP